MKIVIIAEKPSVARCIAQVIGANENHTPDGYISGNGYYVTWAFGHLIQFAMPQEYGFKNYERDSLPMLPEVFKLIPRQVKTDKGFKDDPAVLKQLKVIERLFNVCDQIWVGMDAGREGEAIFRYIYSYLNCKKPFLRLWISSLTEKGIKAGLDNLRPGSDFDNLYCAARARAEADWLIGMNASQALTLAAGQGGYSLGRVQTPTLCMVCDRYWENRNFTPKKYWQLRLELTYCRVDFFVNSVQKYESEDEIIPLLQVIQVGKKITVTKVEQQQKEIEPPLLHDLTSLQKIANEKFGYTADETLVLAQILYEKGLITYPRTASRFLTEDVFEEIPGILENLIQNSQFAAYAKTLKGQKLNRRAVNPEKVTDHHALLPTYKHQPDIFCQDESRIYNLIAGRMLETISSICIMESNVCELKIDDIGFEARGNIIKVPGWKEVFNTDNPKEENVLLPVLKEKDELEILQMDVLEKQTKPQPYLTDASLLALMDTAGKNLEDEEERNALKGIGIGTPATRANIINILLFRDYIRRDKKNLIPTPKGLAVYDLIKDKRIGDIAMTAGWENALGKIEQGKMNVDTFKKGIEVYTAQITTELLNTPLNFSDRYNCICPKCKESKVRFFPNVVKCANPDCGLIVFKNRCEKTLSDDQVVELLEQGKTGIIKGFRRKDGQKIDAALKFDENYNVVFDFPKSSKGKSKRRR